MAGQFTSADSVADGLNRYGYVAGNPTTATDPSGHMACSADFGQCVAPTHYKGHKKVINPGPGGSSGSGGGGKPGCGGCNVANGPTPPPTGGNEDGCVAPSSTYYEACYAKWELTNEGKRADALTLKRVVAYSTHLVGLFLTALADVAIFMTEGSVVPELLAGLDFIFTLLDMAADVAEITDDPSLRAALTWMTGTANAVVGGIRLAISAVKQWGLFGQAAADAAVITMKAAFGGFPSVITSIVIMLAGGVANMLLSGGGHLVTALGDALITEYQLEMSEDIGVWCSENKGVCTKAPINPNPI